MNKLIQIAPYVAVFGLHRIFRLFSAKEHAVVAGHILHRLFLLNVSVVFVNDQKCSAQNRVVFIKP